MYAKKSYGQHFLTNEHTAQKIAGALKPDGAYEHLLEVGPGRGMLTKYLMPLPLKLKVVEADKDMVVYLQQHYPELSPDILAEDFLRLDLGKVYGDQPFAIIGNFPYNISSQILFRMLEYRSQVPELVGMFQLEMAARVVAPPGNKDYGVISVLVQAFYEGGILFKVSKGQFNPPPKVESAVIRLTRKANQDLGCDPVLFRKVVKQAFSQRRKMLRNTLKPFLGHVPDLLMQDAFMARPETLSVGEFVELTRLVSSHLPGGRETLPEVTDILD